MELSRLLPFGRSTAAESPQTVPAACGTDETQPLRTLGATEPVHSRTMLAHAITIPGHGGA
jgi:hypothetical protein